VSDFDSPEFASPSRFALLKSYLSAGKLKTILTKSSANRGLERYRRAGITASSSFISKALNILISFLSVPLTVHYLGAERYGVWLTISSLITWMSMTDFGLAGNALVNVLAEASGREDRAAAQHYTASAFWALTGVSALAGVISVASFRYIPWRSVFRVSASTSTHELQLACGLTLVFFVLAFPLSIQNSIYSAYQDGFLANAWNIGANIFSLAALIVVSQTHGGLPQLVLALSGTRALVSIANCFFLFRRYHWLMPTPSAVRWQSVKRLFSLGSNIPIAPFQSHLISYLPSDPSIYPPPYPVSSGDPITLISSYPCHIHPDHYWVTFVDGPVAINTLVQDDSWDGPLCILKGVAENCLEMVGECEGRDSVGHQIIHFLVFMHF